MKIILIFLIFFTSINVFAKSPYVVFINPGAKDDFFFSRMVSFMEATAKKLDIDLKILYTDRDYFKSFNVSKEILSTKQKLPDYLILINENGIGEFLLPKLDKMGIKVILINEGFSKEKLKKYGKPKEIFKNWIIEYLPDDFSAGYLLAKKLIDKAIKEKNFDENGIINIVGILGKARTTSSTLRMQGLKKAVSEYKGRVKILQTIKADWEAKKAEKITILLLKRYKNISIIWSASDEMALGASNALKKLKIKRNILIGGVDWTLFSFNMINSGEFLATVGGHFMDAGWALVMAYDNFNGVKVQNRVSNSKFYLIDKSNIHFFERYFKENKWDDIDFKSFSLFLNSSLTVYNFGYTSVIKLLKKNGKTIGGK